MTVRIVFDLTRPGLITDQPAAARGLADLTVVGARDPLAVWRPRRPNRCRQFGARHRLVSVEGRAARCRRCGEAFALTVTMSRPPLDLPPIPTEDE